MFVLWSLLSGFGEYAEGSVGYAGVEEQRETEAYRRRKGPADLKVGAEPQRGFDRRWFDF